MRRLSHAVMAIAWLCSFAPALPAADQDRAPIANAVGRFWGFGYSAGYHARYESRLGWNRYVPDRVASKRSSVSPAVHFDSGQPADVTVHTLQPTPMAYGIHSPSQPTQTSSILEGGAPGAGRPSLKNSSVTRTDKMPEANLSRPSRSEQPLKSSPWLRQLLKPEADPPVTSSTILPVDESSPSDRDDLLVP